MKIFHPYIFQIAYHNSTFIFLLHFLSRLRSTLAEKQKEVNELKDRERKLCNCLGTVERPLVISPLPTPTEINNFLKHIDTLETERFKREERYIELKSLIEDIVNELRVEPAPQLEKSILSNDDNKFLISESNMVFMEQYYVSLLEQHKHVKEEIAELKEKVLHLWGLLAEDIKSKNELIEMYAENSVDMLRALKEEVKRCEEVKKSNIEVNQF